MPEAVTAATGTILAFDFGTRRIGIAVGESSLRVARALAEIAGEQNEPRFAAIGKLIAEWQPAHLVVGLPLSPEGETHELARRAERFARQLEGRFGVPVSLVDERYTSVAARAALRGAGARRVRGAARTTARGAVGVDAAAAQLILQQWFDEQRGDERGDERPA